VRALFPGSLAWNREKDYAPAQDIGFMTMVLLRAASRFGGLPE
jgi:hypothetical protein